MNFKQLREKYRSKYPASLVAAAVKIALDMAGAMTPAVKKIEAMKKGLSNDPMVKDALRMANESVNESLQENYAQDLDLAQKNMARLSQKETGQDKKDYQSVARALNQGNLAAVKKVIKGISTDEIRADILNVLVGYNDLIAKMYPKAVDSKGRLKTPMNVSKMIKEDEENLEENVKAVMKKHKKHIDKWKRNNKPMPIQVEDDLMQAAMKAGEIKTDDPDEFDDWLDRNL